MKSKTCTETDSKSDGCVVCLEDFNHGDDDESDVYNTSCSRDCDCDKSPNCELPNKSENLENKSATANQVDFVVNIREENPKSEAGGTP
ncbi:hypothetical protein Q3G72_029799 [Acer saccharum]|nr:hypothetical protein Q3G72_029799 [Acer saccharum]